MSATSNKTNKAYEYSTVDAVSNYALTEWTFEPSTESESRVLPDGCKDFIVTEKIDSEPTWFVSDLSNAAFSVTSSAGERMRGIRLQPGVSIKDQQLSSWLQSNPIDSLFSSDQLDEFCLFSSNVGDALTCLASGKRNVSCVAKDLGVSIRSLQRLLKSHTGQSPQFWLSLARNRKAGRYVATEGSLCEIAVDAGFSDQAHMSREMKKWFGQTPNQIRADQQTAALLFESGYG